MGSEIRVREVFRVWLGFIRVITCVRNLTCGKCFGHYRINLPLSLPWVLFSSRHRHVSAGGDEVFDARCWQD